MKVDGHETQLKLDTGEPASIVSNRELWVEDQQSKNTKQI